MTHRLHFITGLAMLVLAATLAFTVSRRSASQDQASARHVAAPPPRPAASSPAASALPPMSTGPGISSPRRIQALSPAVNPLPPGELQVTIDPAHPRHAELAESANRVERHARERVAALTRALDLTPAQQRRIFPIVARSSDSYDPAMSVLTGTTHAASAPPLDGSESQALLHQELEPGQQDELVEHSIADLMLWEEIIGNLMRQLEQADANPAAAATAPPQSEPAPTEPTSPPPPSRGGRNLFDATNPAE